VPLPRFIARFNRLVTNKVLWLLAYVIPPFTIVVHRGRTSGREYRTPVWAFRTSDGFVIPLTYGASRTDWVKNVLAHGGARLIMRRRRQDVGEPRLVHGPDGMRRLPGVLRPGLRLLRVDDYLVLT
jgi:deazaflavin-dependent oxidoreductase (nitroreductase family)